MLQAQNTRWGGIFPKHCRAVLPYFSYPLLLFSWTPKLLTRQLLTTEHSWEAELCKGCANQWKHFFLPSPPLLGQCFICSMFFKTAAHLRRMELLFSLCMEQCVAAALAQKTIQKYITLQFMQYIYHPKMQTVAPISNSVIFYFFNISYCRHQANKCMIPS